MNLIQQIKIKQKAEKFQRELMKIKKDSPVDFKWFGLAGCCGIVTDAYRIANPYVAIGECKLMFPEIKTEEDLDKQLCTFHDAIKAKSEKVLGKFYTNQAFKGVE